MVLTLRTETTGIRPQFSHRNADRKRAVMDDPSGGAVMRRRVTPTDRLSDRLSWPSANEGQRHLLRTAWTDSKRGVLSLAYTPVGDVDANAVQVVFLARPTIIRIGAKRWAMEASIEEVEV